MKKTLSKLITTMAAATMLSGITAAGAFAADADCVSRALAGTCAKSPSTQTIPPIYSKACNCSGADLSGKDLKDKNFTNVNFAGANLAGAQTLGWIVNGATFDCAKWMSYTEPAQKWCNKGSSSGSCTIVNAKPSTCK